MDTTRLGRTGLMVSRTAFGALPIQRVNFQQAKTILRQAYEGGITFYDTARGYSNSEEKIGYALSDVRDEIIPVPTAKFDAEAALRRLGNTAVKSAKDGIVVLALDQDFAVALRDGQHLQPRDLVSELGDGEGRGPLPRRHRVRVAGQPRLRRQPRIRRVSAQRPQRRVQDRIDVVSARIVAFPGAAEVGRHRPVDSQHIFTDDRFGSFACGAKQTGRECEDAQPCGETEPAGMPFPCNCMACA